MRERAIACCSIALVGAGLCAGRPAGAQSSSSALAHLGHVATGFDAAPDGRGLAITAAREVNTAMVHANIAAADPMNLDAMKLHVGHMLHALAPASGTKGPALGFGVKRAAEAIVTHIEMARKAAEASEPLRTLGSGAANAARALAGRAQAMADLGARISAAQSAADAAPLVEQLRAMALELDTGKDGNGNGRVDLDATEPGMNQLEAQVYAILEAEKLPRILK